MTQVYITRTGGKYHASSRCPSFDDAEREHGRAINSRVVDLKGLVLAPCARCWPLVAGYDVWRQLELDVERTGDSPYESMFVAKVLKRIPRLRPADVTTQQKALGRSGSTYYLDFVLNPLGGYRLAVEIDGTDKAPGEKSIGQVQRDVDRKRADLIECGWKVLNFSNEQVATRSDECISELRAALQEAVPARDPNQPATAPGTGFAGAGLGTATASAAASSPRSRPAGLIAVVVAGVIGGLAGLVWLVWSDAAPSSQPVGGSCPSEAKIKGNVSQSGEKIYHEPGWTYYDQTGAEECFESGGDAESAGYRPSEVQ